jgi:hypothetical protein
VSKTVAKKISKFTPELLSPAGNLRKLKIQELDYKRICKSEKNMAHR